MTVKTTLVPDLPPCPFCGGDAEERVVLNLGVGVHTIACSKCGVQTKAESVYSSALVNWMYRRPQQVLPLTEELHDALEIVQLLIKQTLELDGALQSIAGMELGAEHAEELRRDTKLKALDGYRMLALGARDRYPFLKTELLIRALDRSKT